jgi:Serine acetyltransferase
MRNIRQDFYQKYKQDLKFADFFIKYFFDIGFRVVVIYRIQSFCYDSKFKFIRLISYLLKNKNNIKYGVEIGINAKIGPGFVVRHIGGIVIGDKVRIGENFTIYQHVTIGQNHGKYPKLLNNIIIYPHSKIIGNILITNDVIVGMNSFIRCNIDKSGIYYGNNFHKKGTKHE